MTTVGTICSLSFHMGCPVQETHEHIQQMGCGRRAPAGWSQDGACLRQTDCPQSQHLAAREEGLTPAPHPSSPSPRQAQATREPSQVSSTRRGALLPSLCPPQGQASQAPSPPLKGGAASTIPRGSLGALKAQGKLTNKVSSIIRTKLCQKSQCQFVRKEF